MLWKVALNYPTTPGCWGTPLEELNFVIYFKSLKKEARRENFYYPNNQIIILLSGGICNITSKERGQVIFNETVETDKFQNIKEVLDNIWQYCEENNFTLVLTNILPVCLIRSTQAAIEKNPEGKYILG